MASLAVEDDAMAALGGVSSLIRDGRIGEALSRLAIIEAEAGDELRPVTDAASAVARLEAIYERDKEWFNAVPPRSSDKVVFCQRTAPQAHSTARRSCPEWGAVGAVGGGQPELDCPRSQARRKTRRKT